MKYYIIFASMILAMSAIQTHAADGTPRKEKATPTAEERESMAAMHEKMAQCLRSEKSIRECHEDMEKSCKENMGGRGCMMGHGKHMHHKDL